MATSEKSYSHPHAQSSMIASGRFIFKVGEEAHEVVAIS